MCHISCIEHCHAWNLCPDNTPSYCSYLSTAALTNKFPAGELVLIWALFPKSTYTAFVQAVVYNPYFSCRTQRMTFPYHLSRRMVSHTLISHMESYCSGLMHSQTQWVCRPESHFLLGEVSHCNKAGRGSQGRISTPGRDKWSLVFSTLFFKC